MLQMLEREYQDVVVMPNQSPDKSFAGFALKMQQAQLPELIVHVFQHYYEQLVRGATGYIYNEEANPVARLPDIDALNGECMAAGYAAMDRTVVLKLNGGLGTSMGMEGPKSLLPAKDAFNFLDIIIEQVQHLRHSTGTRLPLVLMDSFSTQKETLAALAEYPDFVQDIAFDFLQHKVPKVRKSDFLPARWPTDPDKEWCPPGHGDLYAALVTGGLLQEVLDAGYEYAFVSNSDNLGATLDPKILGYFALNQLPFLMEVAERTAADRKGGHLAQRPDGQLLLRESAQCPPEEQDAFQDIARYKYFNTNNLWVHLPTLRQVLDERHGVLGLPLIRNEKPVDPTNPKSYRVYQLETAMGSAIAVFHGAQAIRVARDRFIPVKKNSDLLLLWSDVYNLTNEYLLQLNPARKNVQPSPPLIELDDRYYQMIDDMRARFPHGAPSLLECTELRVEGNVFFGKDVVLKGKVRIVNKDEKPMWIEDSAVLQGE
jgi:UTP--glucose-1-phosphate uridylyltransferase